MTVVDCLRDACLGSTPSHRGGARLCGATSADVRRPAPEDLTIPPAECGTREASHVILSKRHAALIATGIAGAMVLYRLWRRQQQR